MNTLWVAILAMLKRDLKIYAKQQGECARPWIFFVMVTTLFPMTLPLSPQHLSEFAPAILWLAVLLSLVVSLETLLTSDFEDGSLEQLLISPHPLPALLLGKLLAQWIAVGLPLLITAPILGILLNLPLDGDSFRGLMITFALGIPLLSLMAAMGSALTVGLRQGGLFLALLVIPWMIPVVLFGARGCLAASLGLPYLGDILLLLAFLIAALIAIPFIMAYTLKVSLQ